MGHGQISTYPHPMVHARCPNMATSRLLYPRNETCADEVDFQVDLRLTWGRPEANVLNVLVNTWNWMRSTWGWLEVDLQVYFVGTRPARFSKNVIYDIGTKILLLKKCVFFLTGKSRFWKRFCQPFLDLKNSKYCTHVCNLLNLSDRQKVIN